MPSSAVQTCTVTPMFSAISPMFVRIHDVAPVYEDLEVIGLDYYSHRSALLPGVSMMIEGVPTKWRKYLDRVGIGAHEIIECPAGPTLTSHLSAKQHLRLRELALAGNQIEFFLATEAQRRFVHSIGLNYPETVWGPPPLLAELLNNKIRLREELADLYPDYRIMPLAGVDATSAIFARVADLVTHRGGAVLKHPTLASGDLLEFIHPDAGWAVALTQSLRKYAKRPYTGDIIVEAAHFQHVALSVQMQIDDDGPKYICATEQQISNGTVHAGNFISSHDDLGLPAEVIKEMKRRSLSLGRRVYALGYRGYIGWDFLYADGRLYLLEANGRVTGAMYPLSVGLQVQANNGLAQWAVGSDNINPTDPCTYDELMRKLGSLAFNGTEGLLPACPRLLDVGNKAMLYAVAGDVAGTKLLLAEARSILVTA